MAEAFSRAAAKELSEMVLSFWHLQQLAHARAHIAILKVQGFGPRDYRFRGMLFERLAREKEKEAEKVHQINRCRTCQDRTTPWTMGFRPSATPGTTG